MKLDCLIIGQGICGTFLAHELEKAGLTYLVIDESRPHTASKAAAGIINPITGRRMVKTWIIEELLPFAMNAYEEIGKSLGIQCISQKSMIDFFPSPQMRIAFLKRMEEDPHWLRIGGDENAWRTWFNYEFGIGEIQPCCLIDLNLLIPAFRKKIAECGKLREEKFFLEKIKLTSGGLEYEGLLANKLIFCDGISSCSNPIFEMLPFAPNKGEAMLVEIDGLPANQIYKRGLSLVPWQDNVFWIGSSYEWEFSNDQPSPAFREKTEQLLKEWLRMPFRILDHFASLRPATLERRPFVGFHPKHSQIGILNGMGTKGCSLAPYFAAQLKGNITNQSPIHPEADINRHSRILSR